MSLKDSLKASGWFSTSAAEADVTVPSGAAVGDIAMVGIFLAKNISITPPSGWTALPTTTFVTNRGYTLHFWKRLTAADSGTWEFDFDGNSAGSWWSGLWSGRLASGSPINISAVHVDNGNATASSGVALAGDDLVYSFGEWTGITATVSPSGFTKAQEDAADGFPHLFTKDNVAAGAVSVIPSPSASTNQFWTALFSLKAAGATPPTGNAGTDQTVNSGDTVTLSGTVSGGTAPYIWAWTQTAGPTVTLSSSTAQSPTFTAPASGGVLTFSMVVTDSTSAAAPASTVNVQVIARPVGVPAAPVNTTIKSWAPAASAAIPLGAASAAGNSLVAILTTRSSTVNGTPITDDAGNVWQYATSTRTVTGLGQPLRQFVYYSSKAAAAANLAVSLVDASLNPVSADGVVHVLEFAGDMSTPLGINQGGNAGTDPTPYGVAIASGSAGIVIGGLGVGVNNRVWNIASGWTDSGHDGTRTDVDQYVGYEIASGAAVVGPSWTRAAGAQTDSTQVTVAFAGGVPVPLASAGAQQAVNPGAGVTLHASASGGTAPYTWSWLQTKGTTVSLSSGTAQNPTFTAADVGTYWFQLVATDAAGVSSAPTTAVVVVNSASTGLPLVRYDGAWVSATPKAKSSGSWL